MLSAQEEEREQSGELRWHLSRLPRARAGDVVRRSRQGAQLAFLKNEIKGTETISAHGPQEGLLGAMPAGQPA